MALYARVSDRDVLRERLVSAGVDLPVELIDLVITAGGATVTAFDGLVALAPADDEPFVPARQLPDDAA